MRHILSPSAALFHADCRDALRQLPDNSIDSCVTDPPYALVSIVKRFGSPNAEPAKGNEAYMRASAGFMGKSWDTGECAMDPTFWVEVLRVLKPGAHVVAFGASRGYHRMACAIEDAGFEIRDSLMWVYGTGFPKSHDVSKGIDKTNGKQMGWFGPWLRIERERRGITQKELAKHFPSKTGGLTGCVANWELGFNIPTVEQFNTLCHVMSLPFEYLDDLEREVIGQGNKPKPTFHTADIGGGAQANSYDITKPRTDAAREWEGWGTALKPAFEPIVLARKPLSEGTVAANVLRWRTGALNIDASRVGSEGGTRKEASGVKCETTSVVGYLNSEAGSLVPGMGRWPANVVHDGSDEVVGAFPHTNGSKRGVKDPNGSMGYHGGASGLPGVVGGYDDAGGSAARFFYSAKASKQDRNGSKHPTVKPISLMEWLCTLITPPGGTVLDPFAGSGTTGIAAQNKGFQVVLCEREAEYVTDIKARFAGSSPGEGHQPVFRHRSMGEASTKCSV